MCLPVPASLVWEFQCICCCMTLTSSSPLPGADVVCENVMETVHSYAMFLNWSLNMDDCGFCPNYAVVPLIFKGWFPYFLFSAALFDFKFV
jgi:hypothetical protein